MEKWYKVICFIAHQGAGRLTETTNYVYAETALKAFEKHKEMRGVKRSRTPTIKLMSDEEAKDLEERIIENGVNLQKAKNTLYFGTRRT